VIDKEAKKKKKKKVPTRENCFRTMKFIKINCKLAAIAMDECGEQKVLFDLPVAQLN